jgi:hypothetical protein
MLRSSFPREVDLQFFRSKQALPAWARPFAMRDKRSLGHALIDDVVNAHACWRPTAGEVAASNLLSIVRSWRNRGADLVQELEAVAVHPQCAISPEKRAAFARRWAKRLAAS